MRPTTLRRLAHTLLICGLLAPSLLATHSAWAKPIDCESSLVEKARDELKPELLDRIGAGSIGNRDIYPNKQHLLARFMSGRDYEDFQGRRDLLTRLDADQFEVGIFLDIPRLGQIDTRGIYGNAFARATPKQINNQAHPLYPPTFTNLIAMAARAVPDEWTGQIYRAEDIEYHFKTALAGFLAAKKESKRKTLVVHTGNWGTGAFGNNPVLIALVQIAAAEAAGVQELRYYTYAPKMTAAFRSAERLYSEFLGTAEPADFANLVRFIEAQKFLYGRGNGT